MYGISRPQRPLQSQSTISAPSAARTLVHERRGKQPQNDADVEANERPGNADECGGDIAARGRAKTRKPAAHIAVKGQA
jgi:hypothetical protein